jgi:hypothetical protein
MTTDPFYIIRISTDDINASRLLLSDEGLAPVTEIPGKKMLWYTVGDVYLCIIESQQASPALVAYYNNTTDILNQLSDLSVICDFNADESGNYFEASFCDPGGNTIIIAEKQDLPKLPESQNNEKIILELSLPSASTFTDTVNFWYTIGFSPRPSRPKPHSWATIHNSNIDIGIHQYYKWNLPGICLHSKNELSKIFKSLAQNPKCKQLFRSAFYFD